MASASIYPNNSVSGFFGRLPVDKNEKVFYNQHDSFHSNHAWVRRRRHGTRRRDLARLDPSVPRWPGQPATTPTTLHRNRSPRPRPRGCDAVILGGTAVPGAPTKVARARAITPPSEREQLRL